MGEVSSKNAAARPVDETPLDLSGDAGNADSCLEYGKPVATRSPLYDVSEFTTIDEIFLELFHTETPESDLDAETAQVSHHPGDISFSEFVSYSLLLFDAAFYRQGHLDAETSDLDAFRHYIGAGWRERRQPHPLFDVDFWERSLSDLGIEIPDQPPICAHVRDKDGWNAATHPLVDPAYYEAQLLERGLARRPDVPPLVDLLTRAEAVPCNYLFDPEFYLLQARVRGRTLSETPILHYVRNGGPAGLDPHPLFDCRFYVETYPDIAAAGYEPLRHFIEFGADEGLDPNPLFSVKHYYKDLQKTK